MIVRMNLNLADLVVAVDVNLIDLEMLMADLVVVVDVNLFDLETPAT